MPQSVLTSKFTSPSSWRVCRSTPVPRGCPRPLCGKPVHWPGRALMTSFSSTCVAPRKGARPGRVGPITPGVGRRRQCHQCLPIRPTPLAPRRSRVGVLIEVDTGMDRAGVDTEEEALALARHLRSCERLNCEDLTGYEGHCSLEPDERRRLTKQRAAMDVFLRIADRLESIGYPCPIRSAGGTATWRWTAERNGVTEIQAGSYVVMDNFHGRMVPDFEHALTIATTVISRPHGRLIVDADSKSVDTDGGATLIGTDLEASRFDEEHGVFRATQRFASRWARRCAWCRATRPRRLICTTSTTSQKTTWSLTSGPCSLAVPGITGWLTCPEFEPDGLGAKLDLAFEPLAGSGNECLIRP